MKHTVLPLIRNHLRLYTSHGEIDEDDIVEEIIKDETDDSIIAEGVAQHQMEARV